MTDFENKESRSLLRRPAVIASTLLILGAVGSASIAYTVRSTVNNNTHVQEFQRGVSGGGDTSSGVTVGYVTSSGAMALSGRTIKIADQLAGTGRLLVNTKSGSVICMPNTSGVMKAVIIDGVTWTIRTPVGTECAE